MGQLDQKVAIITGSDSGIGRAIALLFASEGASVVVNYAHAHDKAEEVRQLIEQKRGKCSVIQADISQYQQAMGLIQQGVEQFGRLDIMVNNAGMEIHSPFLDVTEDHFDRVVGVDLKGPFFVLRLLPVKWSNKKRRDVSSISHRCMKTLPCRRTRHIAALRAACV